MCKYKIHYRTGNRAICQTSRRKPSNRNSDGGPVCLSDKPEEVNCARCLARLQKKRKE